MTDEKEEVTKFIQEKANQFIEICGKVMKDTARMRDIIEKSKDNKMFVMKDKEIREIFDKGIKEANTIIEEMETKMEHSKKITKK